MAKKLNKEQLDILFQCWVEGKTSKERLTLVEQKLKEIPILKSLSIMRKMAKTDPKWIELAEKKKNENERNKLEKEKKLKEKNLVNDIKECLKKDTVLNIEPSFFFCNSTSCFVNNIPCIFRVFSNFYDVILSSDCSCCSKMNKYIPAILKACGKNN